jgi:Tol biopolymer transport system component
VSVMAELEDRFRSLDRVAAPDQWNEIGARVAEIETVPRRPTSRVFVLLTAALLLAALAGAIAVGSWLIRPAPDEFIERASGMIVGVVDCDLVGVDPASGESQVLVGSPPGCTAGEHLRIPTAMSADGRFLAYVVSRYCGACFEESPPEALDGQGAWIYDMTTGAARQLEHCPERYCEEIDISPDGSVVAYTARGRDDEHALMVVDVDSRRSARIDLAGMAGTPSFSPDGKTIVLTLDGGSGLYRVDVGAAAERPASGGLEPVLLFEAPGASNPVWSADGAWIAFNAPAPEYPNGLWVVRSDGAGARLVTAGPGEAGPNFPALSPDGTRIAYLESEYHAGRVGGFTLELWAADIDGGEPSRILNFGCCLREWNSPTWSDDGEYLALGFAVNAPRAGSGVAMVRPDGSDLQLISEYGLEPDWRPIPASDD